MKESESVIMPYEQFEQLPKDQKIKYLTEWIRKYKVKGVIKHWNLKYPPDYYIRLKKLGIYQEIVGKNRMRSLSQSSRNESLSNSQIPPSQSNNQARMSEQEMYRNQVEAAYPNYNQASQPYTFREHGRNESATVYQTSASNSRARKRPAGIIRKIDELGRVVIPQETRSMLGISIFDALEVYTDDETEEIMVKKYSPGCIHCHSFDDLIPIKQKQICRNCLQQIVSEVKSRNIQTLEHKSIEDDRDGI